MIGTFKKLSYERKLGLYFSILLNTNKSHLKNIFRSEFQIKQIVEVI